MTSNQTTKNRLIPSGKLIRFGTFLALAWERLWPLLVPAFFVVIAFSALSWLGVWHMLPLWLHRLVLVIFGLVAIGSLYICRQFSWPGEAEVLRRIEIESKLVDRPMAAQNDEMVMGETDGFSQVLWREHRLRMRERLKDLTGATPKAKGDRFDPYGLRLLLPILAFVAFMISFGGDGGRIGDAFKLYVDPAKLLTRMDIWVNPPAYTNKAPIYLSQKGTHQQNQLLTLPQNSALVARFVGEGEISLHYQQGENLREILASEPSDTKNNGKDNERNFEFSLKESGVVQVMSGNNLVAQWSLDIVEDKVPEISFVGEPNASLSGALQLSYKVSDDYGVVRALGLISPATTDQVSREFDPEFPARFIAPAGARSLIESLEIKLPLPRRRAKSGTAKVNRDLSKHPLAGSRVMLKLVAIDDGGLKGYSAEKSIVLPGRTFIEPIAKALVEQRRILALDANQQDNVVAMLDAVTLAPERFIDDFTAHLALKITYRRLLNANSDDDLRDVMDLMWDVALGIEFGKLSNAERRLREAQERLSEALENGAGDKEISKLMKELRQAMNELMRELAQQAQKNQQAQNPLLQDDASRILRQKDLQRMLDRIEELAKSGSKDAARQLLAEMQRMMDNLRAGRHMQQRQTEGNQTNQALDNLSELMQKQQKLMDETFHMEQQRPDQRNSDNNQPGQENQGNQQQQNKQGQQDENDNNEEMTAQEYADALDQLRQQQKALQEQLNSLNQQLEELGLAPTGEFDEAGEQMGEAGKQLGQGEAGSAAGRQGKALDALRRGAQSMMQQMAGDRQQGGQQDGKGRSDKNSRDMRDPLGRNGQNNGTQSGFEKNTPGEIDAQRARRILESIRKRLSEPKARVIEKNYLERLLKNR